MAPLLQDKIAVLLMHKTGSGRIGNISSGHDPRASHDFLICATDRKFDSRWGCVGLPGTGDFPQFAFICRTSSSENSEVGRK